MIRLASSCELPTDGEGEAVVRIRSLSLAYGDNTSIVRFYTDDDGAFLSVMDGVATLYAPGGVSDEWMQFLSFVPDIRSLRTDAVTGAAVAHVWSACCKTGVLMRYEGDKPSGIDATTALRVDELYPLLLSAFSMPPFDVWYVDVSHRMRHGLCHLACVCKDGAPVSCAMTVAQTETAVLLGAVATAPAWRRRGYAARCVLSLVERLYDRRLYIAPVDEAAQRLYSRLGFVPCHTWAEVIR